MKVTRDQEQTSEFTRVGTDFSVEFPDTFTSHLCEKEGTTFQEYISFCFQTTSNPKSPSLDNVKIHFEILHWSTQWLEEEHRKCWLAKSSGEARFGRLCGHGSPPYFFFKTISRKSAVRNLYSSISSLRPCIPLHLASRRRSWRTNHALVAVAPMCSAIRGSTRARTHEE